MSTLLINLPRPFLATAVLLLGLLVGSFLNVVILRYPAPPVEPEGEDGEQLCPHCQAPLPWQLDLPLVGGKLTGGACASCGTQLIPASLVEGLGRMSLELVQEGWAWLKALSWPGSHCPRCDHPIRAYDNLPVLSWFALRGRCRDCQAPIPARYPLVEAVHAGLWLLLFYAFGPSETFLGAAVFVSVLMALAVIDLDTTLLPDTLTLPLMLGGLVFHAVVTEVWLPYLLAAVGAYLFFLVIELGGLLWLHRPAMGRGDAKLAAAMGAWLGGGPLVVGLFLGFLLGSVVGLVLWAVRGKKEPFPFGPMLASGGVAALFVGEPLARWYLATLGV